jgi:hypothetical protein
LQKATEQKGNAAKSATATERKWTTQSGAELGYLFMCATFTGIDWNLEP